MDYGIIIINNGHYRYPYRVPRTWALQAVRGETGTRSGGSAPYVRQTAPPETPIGTLHHRHCANHSLTAAQPQRVTAPGALSEIPTTFRRTAYVAIVAVAMLLYITYTIP